MTTAYAELWWNFGLFGIGIGLMLSPITSTVLAAVPPTRGGLASSVVNTSRQLGSVLGIAVLGALVEHQEASNLAPELLALHVPARISKTGANSIATAGANAAPRRPTSLEDSQSPERRCARPLARPSPTLCIRHL